MKEFALVCWIATVGFTAGLFACDRCIRPRAEQDAIERANRVGRQCEQLRSRVTELEATLDAVRREQVKPIAPAGERIPAPNPPLPTE